MKSKTKNEDFTDNVKSEVISRMGTRPNNMFKITASNVFDNHWRVNIWSTRLLEGEYSTLTTNFIEYSYFVTFNNQLKTIIKSDPEILSI